MKKLYLSNNNGFTLIEMIVTLAILAILITIGLPAVQNMINDNRMLAQANQMMGMLNMARSEAQKKSRRVLVCASNNQMVCSNNNNWKDGWMVQVVGADIIQQKVAIEGNISIRGVVFTNTATGQIQFDRLGLADSSGSFVICDQQGADKARAINIELSGRIRLATDDDSDGTVNDIEGSEVTCP